MVNLFNASGANTYTLRVYMMMRRMNQNRGREKKTHCVNVDATDAVYTCSISVLRAAAQLLNLKCALRIYSNTSTRSFVDFLR